MEEERERRLGKSAEMLKFMKHKENEDGAQSTEENQHLTSYRELLRSMRTSLKRVKPQDAKNKVHPLASSLEDSEDIETLAQVKQRLKPLFVPRLQDRSVLVAFDRSGTTEPGHKQDITGKLETNKGDHYRKQQDHPEPTQTDIERQSNTTLEEPLPTQIPKEDKQPTRKPDANMAVCLRLLP